MPTYSPKPMAKATLMQIGDAALVKAIMTSNFGKRLWSDYENALLSLIPKYFALISALSSYSMISLFRYKFDGFHTGFAATFMGLFFIVTFNADVWWIVKPILIFLLPFIALFFSKPEKWVQFTFIDCHSLGLTLYGILFCLSSLFHTLRIYFYKDEELPENGRGISWIYILINNLIDKLIDRFSKGNPKPVFKIEEFWVNIIIEPAIFIGLGILMYYREDYYFAAFLWICALSEIWIQIKLKVYEMEEERLKKL